MPTINDRIGSQNVIRVLSNASAPPTKVINLTDVASDRKTLDGQLLVWNLSDEKFYMTDTIDTDGLIFTAGGSNTGITTFSGNVQSTAATNGAVIVSGGVGIGKNLNVGKDLVVAGIATFSNLVSLAGAVSLLKTLDVAGITSVLSLSIGSTQVISDARQLQNITSLDSTTRTTIEDAINDTDVTQLHITGVSTFIGLSTFASGIIVESGISTFNTLVDVNNRVDVAGGANVDQLNVVGVSTFGGTVDVNANLDVSGNLTVGGTIISEDVVNLDSLGIVTARNGVRVTAGGLVVSAGVNTISSPTTFNALTNVGSAITMYNTTGIISATKFYGDGGNLTNTGATLSAASGDQRLVVTSLTSGTMINAATDADLTYNGTTDVFNVGSGVSMYASAGIVSAVGYKGNLTIGTPTGGFKSGAFTINDSDYTKDDINQLNFILGKLVPTAPDTINGVAIDLDNDTEYYLCSSSGFTPTNNTGGSAPDQTGTTKYVRNTDSTVTTDWLTEYGPGDSETVTGFINAVGVGTTTLSTANNDGTYDKLVIANNEDASNSTRNTGITSQFYEIFDLRLLNAVSPDGYNKAHFTQGASVTGSTYWYEDPSTVGVPDVTFGTVSTPDPSTDVVAYSSGIPHYTQSTNNVFSYVITVTNCTGDMYYQNNNRLLWAEGATTGFNKPDSYKLFNETKVNGVSGTHPPIRNYGVGTGATVTASHTPNNVHATITSNHFHGWDCWTPYGSDLNEEATISEAVNIMGTTADYTNNVDEDAIECTVGSLTGGSATRVNAGATGDNPTPAYTAWGGGSAGSIATYEAAVRGGDLRHDQTDYSTGYLPVGPDYSSSRSGNQYFQFQFIQASISEFRISYTGSLAGCWVCMPDNSTWTTSLSGKNGWADMFAAYKGSGVPTSAEPGCATGGNMDTNGGTFTCTFGTESSSNDSNNRVLIRFKLTSGNSISDISLSDT